MNSRGEGAWGRFVTEPALAAVKSVCRFCIEKLGTPSKTRRRFLGFFLGWLWGISMVFLASEEKGAAR